MSLHACEQCTHIIADDARTCPHCGTHNHMPMYFEPVIGLAVAVGTTFILYLFIDAFKGEFKVSAVCGIIGGLIAAFKRP